MSFYMIFNNIIEHDAYFIFKKLKDRFYKVKKSDSFSILDFKRELLL
jgi:hypothetical protein